jgi:hypothetical protein
VPESEKRQRAAYPAAHGDTTLERARRLHGSGDHEGALFLLSELLQSAPQHPEVANLSAACGEALEADWLADLGSESVILGVMVSEGELKKVAMDHTEGFLVSLMNGATTLEDLLDLAGMPRLAALRHLRRLREQGVIAPLSQRRQTTRPSSKAPEAPDIEESGELWLSLEAVDLDVVPWVLVEGAELRAMNLEPGAQLLLSLADGQSSLRAILHQANMGTTEGIAILERLARDGIVAFL